MDEDPHKEFDDHGLVKYPKSIVPETRKRPTWIKITLNELEGHDTPHGTFMESKKLKKYFFYVAMR